VNQLPGESQQCFLEIAGIICEIDSYNFHIPSLLNPLYQLFIYYQKTCTINVNKLHLTIQPGKNDCAYRNDLHPQAINFRDSIILEFSTGRLTYDFPDRSGEFITPRLRPTIELEYILRILYAYFVLFQGGILIHGAGISRGGKGYIFFGPSGVGKSTVSLLSNDSLILNDDLTAIMCDTSGIWKIFSTPFANPGQNINNISVPLSGIYQLSQSCEVSLVKVSHGIALSELISNVPVLSGDIHRSEQLVSTSDEILKAIPFYRLNFRNDPSFWKVIKNQEELFL
jgi:hypothetical protein